MVLWGRNYGNGGFESLKFMSRAFTYYGISMCFKLSQFQQQNMHEDEGYEESVDGKIMSLFYWK